MISLIVILKQYEVKSSLILDKNKREESNHVSLMMRLRMIAYFLENQYLQSIRRYPLIQVYYSENKVD